MNQKMELKKGLILAWILLWGYILTASPPIHQDLEIISTEKTEENVIKLAPLKLDRLMEWKNRLYFIISSEEKVLLQKYGITFSVERPASASAPENITHGININGAYHTYTELEQEIRDIENRFPSIIQVKDIGKSLESRSIYAVKISDNVSEDEDEAEVIFIGCHHAREWISVEVPFLFIKHLAEQYESNTSIKSLVDKSEIWIIPLLNPDGLEYSIYVYRYWRKNMRDNGDGSYGVDLNRNYDYMWGIDNVGSSSNTTSSVYRGTAPFSEPETQAVRDLFRDRNFQALVSYHSYSQIIIYPWGYTPEAPPDSTLHHQIVSKMSDLMWAVNGRTYSYGQAGQAMYLTNGDTTDWSYGIYGIPSLTIELPPIDLFHGGFFNAEEDIQSIFNENLPAMIYLIEWCISQHESGKT